MIEIVKGLHDHTGQGGDFRRLVRIHRKRFFDQLDFPRRSFGRLQMEARRKRIVNDVDIVPRA